MHKSLIMMAFGACAAATPASARDGAWYVGGDFGAMIVEDTDVDINTVENALSLDHDYGYDGALFVGYDLGAFRLEAEAAYKKADLDAFATSISLPGEGPSFPTERDFASGSTSALSFMLNGMLDLGDDDGLSGFVGVGGGIARVSLNNARVFDDSPVFLEDSDSSFAWQVIAALRHPVGRNIDVTVKYRFFNVSQFRWDDGSDEAEARFRSHSILGGITFNFGAPPPPPPPPPP